jgi:hypothetical protein
MIPEESKYLLLASIVSDSTKEGAVNKTVIVSVEKIVSVSEEVKDGETKCISQLSGSAKGL